MCGRLARRSQPEKGFCPLRLGRIHPRFFGPERIRLQLAAQAGFLRKPYTWFFVDRRGPNPRDPWECVGSTPLGARLTRCPTLSAHPCLAVASDDVFIGHTGSEQTAIAFSGFQRVGAEGDMGSDSVRDNQPLVLSDIWSVKGRAS